MLVLRQKLHILYLCLFCLYFMLSIIYGELKMNIYDRQNFLPVTGQEPWPILITKVKVVDRLWF